MNQKNSTPSLWRESRKAFLLFASLLIVTLSFSQPYRAAYWNGYNTSTQTFPVNGVIQSSYVTSAVHNMYALTGLNDGRNIWSSTNSSTTLNPATAPYLSYTITTTTAITFDRFVLSGLAITSPVKLQLRSSLDNYTTSLGEFTGNSTNYYLTSVPLTALGTVASGTVTFRIYFYAATSGTGYAYLVTGNYSSLDGTPASYAGSFGSTAIYYSSPAPTCSGTPTAGTASVTPASGNINSYNSAALSLSGYTSGVLGIGLQWQSSTTSGGTYTDISGATSAAYSTPPATGANTLYYRAKVTCSTSGLSSYSNILTVSSTPMKSPGNALALDGTDDFVSMPASTKADIDSGTIELWVKRAVNNGVNMTLVAKRSTSATRYSFHMGDNLLGLYNGTLWSFVSTPQTFTVNKWYHVAFVCRSAGTSVFLNGDSLGRTTHTIGTVAGLPMQIGNSVNTGAGEMVNGSVDEVRIWNRPLLQSEIRAAMADTVAPNAANLVAYYRLDQGIAGGTNTGVTTVYDLTATAYNGVATNLALTGSTSNWVQSAAMVIPISASATNVAGNVFTANWSAPNVGGITHYFLDVSTAPDFSTFVPGYQAMDVGTATSVQVTGLSMQTNYYYRVRGSMTSAAYNAGYSDVVAVTTNSTLPLKLVDFKAAQQNSSVMVTWATASETATRQFSVERSTDGTSFAELTHINAAGNAQTTRKYSFADKYPVTGISYYRLKIIGSNGTVEYSQVISMVWGADGKPTLTLAPQPFHDLLTVKVTGLVSKGEFRIYSLGGNEIRSYRVSASGGTSTLQINRGNLSSGVYFYKLNADNGKLLSTGKIIVD